MSQKVPFIDFSSVHSQLKADILKKIEQIMDQGSFVLGPEVTEFEKEFAQWNGSQKAVGVASGMDALTLSLKAVGVGPGDEVIIPAHTFIATALAVTHCGAKPVLVDVDSDSSIDVTKIEAAITDKTKALLPVHLYGLPVKMNELMAVANKHGLKVIEDTAQAHGAQIDGKSCGSFGDAGCFSFYPTKNMGAMGDAGAVITNDSQVADRVSHYRNVGQVEKNDHQLIGHNSRLDSFQAAALRVKLPHIHKHNELRQKAAQAYNSRLSEISGLTTPLWDEKRASVFHLYVVTTESNEKREALRAHLSENGIACAIHYPQPIHLHTCYADLGYKPGDFPMAEHICSSALSLPMFPGMSTEQIDLVCQSIAQFYKA